MASWRMIVKSGQPFFRTSTFAACFLISAPRGLIHSAAATIGVMLQPVAGSMAGATGNAIVGLVSTCRSTATGYCASSLCRFDAAGVAAKRNLAQQPRSACGAPLWVKMAAVLSEIYRNPFNRRPLFSWQVTPSDAALGPSTRQIVEEIVRRACLRRCWSALGRRIALRPLPDRALFDAGLQDDRGRRVSFLAKTMDLIKESLP